MLAYIRKGKSEGDIQMKLLKMNGYPITNILDYNKYFNIYDVLRHKNEFMIFVSSHFANLSKTFSYCSAMVYTTINDRIPVFMRNGIYEKENPVDFNVCDAKNFWNNPFAFSKTCCPSAELLNMSKELAKQFADKNDDIVFKKAMLITIAAFAFLDDYNIESKIDIEKAKKSFLGKEEKERKNHLELHLDDDMSDCIQTITLDPSSQVYSALTFDEVDFTKIKTFRVVASKKINSLSNRTVKISVGEEQITVPAGEHIYINTINGQIVNLLKKSQTKKGRILHNPGAEKDALKFDDENVPLLEFYRNEYVSSFDFSPDDNSIIYINNLRLCLDKCFSPILLEQLSEYCDMNIVEVKLVNSRFYLLKNNGELLSNDLECNGMKNVYSIKSVLRKYQR